jgi:cytosine/adenosine deaminase-related metal-dependent hydrolase
MTSIRAAWILPIDRPPIENGRIEIDHGRIVGVGPAPVSRVAAPGIQDLGHVAVLPGLVNAHTHLELSWLRGRVPPASTFTEWVKTLFAIRGRPDGDMSPEQIAAIDHAVKDVRAFGTAAVGDISNSLMSTLPIQRAGLHGVVFHELLGFTERDGALVEATRAVRSAAIQTGVRVSLAPHAPYSTSLELFRAIRRAVDAGDCRIMSVHLGESAEEVELLLTGTGAWRGILEWIGAWRDDWVIPRCDPVGYLDRHGLIDSRTLVVHGVQFDDRALHRLAAIGATLVTCPRSNHWVGAGYPPIERFYQSGVRVAVGTDSLASVADLNVFAELQTMRWLAPSVPAARILASATLAGAHALGLADQLGSITPGKRAELIAIRLPDVVDDVEEYLVSGIEPSQVTWVA